MIEVQPADLARMWERHDPVPVDLVDRLLAAIAVADVDDELELLQLVTATGEPAGVRGADRETITFVFVAEQRSLLLRIAHSGARSRRIDGWVTPPGPGEIRIESTADVVRVPVDDGGRFEVAAVTSGSYRIFFSAPALRVLATEFFDL